MTNSAANNSFKKIGVLERKVNLEYTSYCDIFIITYKASIHNFNQIIIQIIMHIFFKKHGKSNSINREKLNLQKKTCVGIS